MIPKKQLGEIKNELIECQNPFFFFHNDDDGLCAFLLLYRFKGGGKWHMVKPRPYIDESFTRFVPEDCDKVFILDIAVVKQEFVDEIKKPVVWIDHHTPLKISKCRYFNPRIEHPEEYTPASAICYEAVRQDLLIGALGTIADGGKNLGFLKESFRKYKSIIGKYRKPFDITYKTEFGKLIRILSFNLNGKTSEIKKSIGIFIKEKDFQNFLNPSTKDEKFVHGRYETANEEYKKVLEEALGIKSDDVFVFLYRPGRITFGGDIATEIPYRLPGKKIYIIAREKSGRMMCSLRSNRINLLKFLEKAFKKIEGYGGGHPVAAGCSIRKEDFEKFIELAKKA